MEDPGLRGNWVRDLSYIPELFRIKRLNLAAGFKARYQISLFLAIDTGYNVGDNLWVNLTNGRKFVWWNI